MRRTKIILKPLPKLIIFNKTLAQCTKSHLVRTFESNWWIESLFCTYLTMVGQKCSPCMSVAPSPDLSCKERQSTKEEARCKKSLYNFNFCFVKILKQSVCIRQTISERQQWTIFSQRLNCFHFLIPEKIYNLIDKGMCLILLETIIVKLFACLHIFALFWRTKRIYSNRSTNILEAVGWDICFVSLGLNNFWCINFK